METKAILKLIVYSFIFLFFQYCSGSRVTTDRKGSIKKTSCIEVVATVIDDSLGGDNDGKLDFYEPVKYFVTLRNTGSVPISGIATLSSPQQGVLITQNTAFYDTIPVGQVGTSTEPFAFTVTTPTDSVELNIELVKCNATVKEETTYDVFPCIEWHEIRGDLRIGVTTKIDTLAIKMSACYESVGPDPIEDVVLEINILNLEVCGGTNLIINTIPTKLTSFRGNESQQYFGDIAPNSCNQAEPTCHNNLNPGLFLLTYDRQSLYTLARGDIACLKLNIKRYRKATWSDCNYESLAGGKSFDKVDLRIAFMPLVP